MGSILNVMQRHLPWEYDAVRGSHDVTRAYEGSPTLMLPRSRLSSQTYGNHPGKVARAVSDRDVNVDFSSDY